MAHPPLLDPALRVRAVRILRRYHTRPSNHRLHNDIDAFLSSLEELLEENERLRDIITAQEIRLRGSARGA